MKMKRLVAIALLVALCGCDVINGILTAPPEVTVPVPVVMDIGMVVPLTGEHSATYGESMQRGFNLARDEINSTPNLPIPINLIPVDDMSTAQGMINAFKNLIEMDVPAIVGVAISSFAQLAFHIAQENEVVVVGSVTAAAGLSSIGDYIFRVSLATDTFIPAGVKLTHEKLGYEKVALIYDEADLYSMSSNEQVEKALQELGVEILTTQTFKGGDADLTEQLTMVKELNPDVLFVSALALDEIEIMVQGRALGLEARYIVPGLSGNYIEPAGDAANGAIAFAGWDRALDNPLNHAFVERYEAAYGVEPDPFAAQSYACLHILFHAIVDALAVSPEPGAKAIRDALADVRDFDTNLGSFSFDANGEAVYEPTITVVNDGKVEIF